MVALIIILIDLRYAAYKNFRHPVAAQNHITACVKSFLSKEDYSKQTSKIQKPAYLNQK
jgi:hypothetical protein